MCPLYLLKIISLFSSEYVWVCVWKLDKQNRSLLYVENTEYVYYAVEKVIKMVIPVAYCV